MTEATQRFEALVKPEGPAGHPIEANHPLTIIIRNRSIYKPIFLKIPIQIFTDTKTDSWK
jgi:hypothetical protein